MIDVAFLHLQFGDQFSYSTSFVFIRGAWPQGWLPKGPGLPPARSLHFEWEEPWEEPWESDAEEGGEQDVVGSGSESDNEAAAEITGTNAEEELVAFLLNQHCRGKLTAKDLCITAFWAGKAGRQRLEPLGLNPQAASGNFSRHLDAYMRKREGAANTKDYVVSVPGFLRSAGERSVHHLICRPPHEIMQEEMAKTDVQAAWKSWGATAQL